MRAPKGAALDADGAAIEGQKTVSDGNATVFKPTSENSQVALAFHPLAKVFPLLEGAEFDRLVADIAAQDLLNSITLYQGKVLDGRNRFRACQAAGVAPRYVEFEGDDAAAAAFVPL